MRAEYDFRRGVRGKHSKAMQAGYTITIHKADGTTMVKDVMPKEFFSLFLFVSWLGCSTIFIYGVLRCVLLVGVLLVAVVVALRISLVDRAALLCVGSAAERAAGVSCWVLVACCFVSGQRARFRFCGGLAMFGSWYRLDGR